MPTPNWPDAPAPGSAATRPLPALILALAARQVRYCHWKSNVRLAESLAGREDLQLRPRLCQLVEQRLAQQRFVFGDDAGADLSHDGSPTASCRW